MIILITCLSFLYFSGPFTCLLMGGLTSNLFLRAHIEDLMKFETQNEMD